MSKAYSYIVARDYGFAPNPFYGVLTLATCKPGIRKTASVGDLIIGCSDKAHGNKLIYVALVSEVLTFDQYWNDLRFAKKKPVMNGSLKKLYGDNIYHHDANGNWMQENDWLRRIVKADPSQSLYDNRITTGNAIDGKCIRLATLAKYCGEGVLEQFLRAVKGCCHFSFRFDYCGYDGTLWCEPRENGDVMAGFSKEYRRCTNGYYYLLINDDTLIGYDVD